MFNPDIQVSQSRTGMQVLKIINSQKPQSLFFSILSREAADSKNMDFMGFV